MGTKEMVDGYLKAWSSKDFAGCRKLLADDLDFQGSMDKQQTADAFMVGLKLFVNGMYESHTVVDALYGDGAAFLLYDCTLVDGGTMRCAEFFKLADGKIKAIRLTFDTYPLRKNRPKT